MFVDSYSAGLPVEWYNPLNPSGGEFHWQNATFRFVTSIYMQHVALKSGKIRQFDKRAGIRIVQPSSSEQDIVLRYRK